MRTQKRTRIAALMLILSILFSACGGARGNAPTAEPSVPATDSVETQPAEAAAIPTEAPDIPAEESAGFASYGEIALLAAENHKPYTRKNAKDAMNIDRYAISDKGLLSQAEIKSLRTTREKSVSISVEQAKADADLFFRTWKYCYPSYYFMGEELFLSAKEQVLTTLSGFGGSISGQELGDILYEAMSFLQDDHSSIDGKSPTYVEGSLYYISYLDITQTFDRDENGYYQTYNGEKWYYVSASREDIRIEPVLLPSGKAAYCPMLLIPRSESVVADTMVLSNAAQEKTAEIHWVQNEDVSFSGSISSQCLTESSKDIYYINYLDMHSENGDVADFLKTAKEAKKYKAVIFDLRHTMGYEHWQLVEWIKRFTGANPSVSSAYLTRDNALRTLKNYQGFRSAALGQETARTWYESGRKIPNEIPMIILTDKSVLSSIESSLSYLKTLDNTIVIGSNTRGCHQGGSVQTYYLPHSGVPFAIGGFMVFEGEAKNIDGIGFEPDIWCNPADALLSALRLLQYYGLADAESVMSLYDMFAPADAAPLYTSDVPYVRWHDNIILAGQIFGNISDTGDDTVYVYKNNDPLGVFIVRSENPELLSAESTMSKIQLKRLAPFHGETVGFTITYRGNDYTFYCNDDTWKP